MDVPLTTLNLTLLLSPGTPEGEPSGENEAKISTPGALTSGCKSTIIC